MHAIIFQIFLHILFMMALTLLNVLNCASRVPAHALGTRVGIQSGARVKHETLVCRRRVRVIIAPAVFRAGILARRCGGGRIREDRVPTLAQTGLPAYKGAVDLTCASIAIVHCSVLLTLKSNP